MTRTADEYWEFIHVERARVAHMLDGLTAEQWQASSLCGEWRVEQVVAHLTAAANIGRWAWLRSILFAGFNPDRHNARRLGEHLGRTADETGENFRRSTTLTIAPTRDYPAWLGEGIVHGQDIARPLGVTLTPDPEAVREVATYFAAKDFAVNSRRMVKELSLEASDTDFDAGSGPLVRGPLLSLVMVMAGRRNFLADVEGDGVEELRRRIG